MASLGTLVVNLKANTDQFKRGMQSAEATMGSFRDAAFAAATGAAGLGLLKLAADAETLKVKLEVLLKSGSAANEMFRKIGDFAASTPFQKHHQLKHCYTLVYYYKKNKLNFWTLKF